MIRWTTPARRRPGAGRATARCAYLACLTLAPAATAAAGQASSGGVEVVVRTIDEEAIRGRLVGLDPAQGLTLRVGADEQRNIRIPDLVRILMPSPEEPQTAGGWRVRLHNGDFLTGWPADAASDVVTFDTRALGPVRIPVELMHSLETAAAPTPAWSARVAGLVQAPASEDVVLLTNGDALTGFVTHIDHEAFTLDATSGSTRIPRDVVVAVRFADADPPRTALPCFLIELRGGGRVTVESASWHSGVLRGLASFGQEVYADAERIAAMHVIGGRWRWLSELEPISATQTPMLSLDWPHRADRNVRGGPLEVAGAGFEHGIGVHSRSVLVYELAGQYREFVTSFGLDDDSGPEGDVSVRVVVDEKVRYTQEHVRRGRLFGPIRIDLLSRRGAGSPGGAESRAAETPNPDAPAAKRLQLIVDFGDNGDIQDRFDWIEAALIRR